MNDTLFVIPARSGSVGVKNKNIISWKGKPLIMHSFDFLVSQNIALENICISSDSDEYINFFIKNGINKKCILKRPKALAENLVVDYPVILHAWCIKEELLKRKFEYIAIVRPTSPERPKDIISKGLKILQQDKKITSVRAMRKVTENPFRIWKKNQDNNYMIPLIENVFEPGNIPRQLLSQDYYYQSGELEIIRRSTLQLGSICGTNVSIIEIKENNIDIDTTNDLKG